MRRQRRSPPPAPPPPHDSGRAVDAAVDDDVDVVISTASEQRDTLSRTHRHRLYDVCDDDNGDDNDDDDNNGGDGRGGDDGCATVITAAKRKAGRVNPPAFPLAKQRSFAMTLRSSSKNAVVGPSATTATSGNKGGAFTHALSW